MTDHDRTDEPDARDEALAAHLAVPPLDAVTRRRLVRRALTETASPVSGTATRVLQVAAAVAAAVVVVGTAALVLREDGPGSRDAAETSAGTTADAPAGEALDAAPEGLTDLGEVADPAVLLQRLDAARAAEPGPTATTEATGEAGTTGLAPACLAALEGQGAAGPPTFTATATYEGRPALVVVALVASGDATPVPTAFVLDAATCTPLGSVGLG